MYRDDREYCFSPRPAGDTRQLANVYLDSPYYRGHCRVMCVSSPVYPVIIGNVHGAHRMLKDPDWMVEDQPGVPGTSSGNKNKDDGDHSGDMPSWMFE